MVHRVLPCIDVCRSVRSEAKYISAFDISHASYFLFRKEISSVQSIDVFSTGWNTDEKPLEVDGESAMLIFVNLGADPGLLNGTDEATKRLRTGLVALQAVLHPRGTVVIAMGSIASFNFSFMEGK